MNRGGRWTLRRVFRLPTTSGRVRRELDDELRFHLEGRVEELMAREQLTRGDAEIEARRRFGDFESYRLETEYIDRSMLQRRNKMELIDTIRRELGHAIRSLRRAPAFSLVAMITLALGLGATTTIFTLLDRVVLRPLPYPSADRLIRVATKWPGLKAGMEYGISEFMFFRFKQSSKTLEDIGVYQDLAIPLPAIDGAEAEQVPALRVSASLFNVLGIRPELGTLFTAADERAQTTTGPILLSHDLWVRRYGADPNIIGKTLPGGSKRVIGVLPPSATLPDESPALWLPLQIDPSNPPRNQHTYSSIALMKRGVAVDHALAELGDITHQITVDYPNTYGDHFMKKFGFGFIGRSLRDDVVGPAVVRTLWIVFASVAFVLLIAAANVANLFLVRIDARRREMAVRAALGANRSHLAVSYLCESCLLALVAAAGAMGLSWVLLRVALHLAPSSLPRMSEVSIGWPSALFCFVVSLGAGVLFGVLPLARSALDIGALRDGGRNLTSSRSRHAARRTLVVSQVALAAVLLASAGLVLRSFQKLHAVRPGFDAHHVLTMSLSLRQDRYQNDAQLVAFWSELARRIAALAGVTGVGSAYHLPLDNFGNGCTAIVAPESPLEESQQMQCKPIVTVTPGYFKTMRIPITGHEPDWSDDASGAGSMVVSRALAERMWPGESPIGKTVVYSVARRLSFTITGVAEDVRAAGLEQPPLEIAYFPITAPAAAGPAPRADMDANYQEVVIRSSVDDGVLAAEVRRIVANIDPRVPVAQVRSMDAIVGKSIAWTSFTMTLMLLSALIALSLSAAGIYGVISYIVGQRRAEIGVRIALGARSRDVSALVVGQSMTLAATGILIGVLASIAGGRFLRALLFEVSPTDPLVLAASCAMLAIVVAAASFAPARRAARIDPVEAMRA